jgi:Mlc titration factor MtfA (ptsG expression regulator)
MKIFLAEKTFTACGGLRTVDDAMAVTIAGHACLLLAGRGDAACFPGVESVLVYPDSFYSRVRNWDAAAGVEFVHTEARVGEASPMGSVVLSWREVLQASALAGNGRNVVVHEFAHHLRPVGAVLLAELDSGFRRLCAAPDADPVLDSYGAENKDEFWAVSVEAFFDDAVRLREAHPAWYRALAVFFEQDTAAQEIFFRDSVRS